MQCTPPQAVREISPNKVFIQQVQLAENQKQVNFVYYENQIPTANKVIYLAYYDESTLKRIILTGRSDINGIATFLIPSIKNSGSAPFYFSFNNTDYSGNNFAVRIAPKSVYEKAGEQVITLKVDKSYHIELQDAGVQLINFPQDGTKTSNGGDIFGAGSKFSLR
jgi:hypothetical protein